MTGFKVHCAILRADIIKHKQNATFHFNPTDHNGCIHYCIGREGGREGGGREGGRGGEGGREGGQGRAVEGGREEEGGREGMGGGPFAGVCALCEQPPPS